jgi:hypothetical protein
MAGAGLLVAALPASAATTDTTARFAVMRDDDRIGEGLVAYSREGDLLRVRVDMEAKVDFGFVTVYRYRHESEELWRGGRLVGLRGSTNDDGKKYRMTARPTAAGLAVEGTKGDFTAPADVLPLSYWHPDTIKRSQLLDASKGRLLSVAVDAGATETQEIGTGRVLARRYGISGDLALTLWYDTLGAWVRTRMLKKGAPIDLVLMDPPILTTALVAPAVPGTWAGNAVPTTLASNPPNG